MWTELEQLSTVPVHRMLVPVHPSKILTLTAFQDLRVCQSLNGSYIKYYFCSACRSYFLLYHRNMQHNRRNM